MPDRPPTGHKIGSAPTGAVGLAIGVLWVVVCLGGLLFFDRKDHPRADEITITYRCPEKSADFCRAAAAEVEKWARERVVKVEDIGP